MSGRSSLGFRPTATSSATSAGATWRREWAVEFGRFFNYPARTAATPVRLRPQHKGRLRSSGGTWLLSATSATLALQRTTCGGAHVLTVSVLENIYEEHYVYSLNFTWPQVSCIPQCPVRGSRVVFASYMDCSGQVQKFAVRFPTSKDAEIFLDSVKERLRDITDVSTLQNDFVCENSSPSELNITNETYQRFDEESNCTTLFHQMPSLDYHRDQLESPMQPALAEKVDPVFPGLPPSFTDFLNSCSTVIEKDVPQPNPRTHCEFKDQGHIFNPSAKEADASKQSGLASDAHLQAQIAKYLSDANFNEMLSQIEMVITELGGDLSLDF